MKRIILFALVAFVFTSCQKQVDWVTPSTGDTTTTGGGTTPTGDLVVRSVSVTGTDTTTTLYSYDSQKRLQSFTSDGKAGGMATHIYNEYVRDATGRIVTTKQKSESFGITTDTIFTTVHYPNATTQDFSYTTAQVDLMGLISYDSTIAVYNSGKLAEIKNYQASFGSPYELLTNYQYTYNAAERVISQLSIYHNLVPSQQDTTSYTYTYNNNVAAGHYYSNNASQNYLIHSVPNKGAFVQSKTTSTSNTMAMGNTTMTYTYTLGAGNKPTAFNLVITNPPVTTKVNLFYQ